MDSLLNTYTLPQWLLLFYIYCFIGWVWESSYMSVKTKHLTNRGFMYGPMIPIYGSGAIVMLFTTLPVKENVFLVYIVSLVAATTLEIVTGTVMESIFKVRYWDYSDEFLNYKGHICLKASLFWGVAGVGLVFGFNRPISALVLSIPKQVSELLAFAITVVAACDFGASFREAMDVRSILERLSEEKDKQFKRIEKRIDVMSAVYAEEFNKSKEYVSGVMHEYVGKLQQMKESGVEKVDGLIENGQEHASELVNSGRARVELTKAKLELLSESQRGKLRRYLKANPLANSGHREIKVTLEEIKNAVKDYRNKKNKEV